VAGHNHARVAMRTTVCSIAFVNERDLMACLFQIIRRKQTINATAENADIQNVRK
jgi:hypothetical protein